MASRRLPSSEFHQKLSYNLPNLINRALVEIVTKHPHGSFSSTQRQQRAVSRGFQELAERVIPFVPEAQGPQSAGLGAVPARVLSGVLKRRRFTLRGCRGGSARREAVAALGLGGTLALGEGGCLQPLVAL